MYTRKCVYVVAGSIYLCLKGAFVGCLASLAFTGWIGIGAFYYKVSTSKLSPVITTGCTWYNTTTTTTATTITAALSNVTTTTVAPADPT